MVRIFFFINAISAYIIANMVVKKHLLKGKLLMNLLIKRRRDFSARFYPGVVLVATVFDAKKRAASP